MQVVIFTEKLSEKNDVDLSFYLFFFNNFFFVKNNKGHVVVVEEERDVEVAAEREAAGGGREVAGEDEGGETLRNIKKSLLIIKKQKLQRKIKFRNVILTNIQIFREANTRADIAIEKPNPTMVICLFKKRKCFIFIQLQLFPFYYLFFIIFLFHRFNLITEFQTFFHTKSLRYFKHLVPLNLWQLKPLVP